MTRSLKFPARPHVGGFTLVEMLITVTILAILTAMAAPSFSRLFANNRMVTSTNDFKNALQHAKSEAQRRGAVRGVSIRAVSGTQSFTTGWQVFTDDGLDGEMAGDDAVLQEHAGDLGTTTTITRVLRSVPPAPFTYSEATSTPDRMVVTFNTQGQNTAAAPAFFRVCDSALPSLPGRIVQVSIAGIVSLDSTTEVCP